jgi:hypothetical protein
VRDEVDEADELLCVILSYATFESGIAATTVLLPSRACVQQWQPVRRQMMRAAETRTTATALTEERTAISHACGVHAESLLHNVANFMSKYSIIDVLE